MRAVTLPAIVAAIILGASLPGCRVGYDSLVFATKTNLGLDVDTKPPTAELSLSRVEGVYAPTFEQGKSPPVAASFRYTQGGLFAGAVAATFLAGDAATVMSGLYADPDLDPMPPDLTLETGDQTHLNAALVLKVAPVLPSGEEFLTEGKVRPVFFGTSTSIGIKVTWSGMAAAFPDSLHVGYKRKELAWAPVTYKKVSDTEHRVETPSLLATIDAKASTGRPGDTRVSHLQYFATGTAATALAFRSAVRIPFINRLDPQQLAPVVANSAPAAIALQDRINTWLKNGQEDPQTARVDELKSWLRDNVPGQNPDLWAIWLPTAPNAQLESAIQTLSIP